MSQCVIKSLVLGTFSTNCYIVYKEGEKRALIIDPADEAARIEHTLVQLGVEPEAILLTHGHIDHMMAAGELKERYGISVYAHEDESDLAGNPGLNLAAQLSGSNYTLPIDKCLQDGQQLELAGISLKVLHTPGHTQGSVCYYDEADGILFSGDTLFAGSVGRTDFPTGSGTTLIRSLQEKLKELPEETAVYPGHGEDTTIGYEKKYNPYM